MNYYLVDAQFGHVGRNKYIIKTIATLANTAKEAAKQVRFMPRVKHDRKDAIIQVVKVDEEEFKFIKNNNDNDIYLKVTTIQNQRRLCKDLDEQVKYYDDDIKYKKRNNETIKFKQKKYKEIIKAMYL